MLYNDIEFFDGRLDLMGFDEKFNWDNENLKKNKKKKRLIIFSYI